MSLAKPPGELRAYIMAHFVKDVGIAEAWQVCTTLNNSNRYCMCRTSQENTTA